MSKNMQFTSESLIVPLTQKDYQIAAQFAAEQPTPEKQQQVRNNTLAVCAVDNYLQFIGISTDKQASDSWNRVIRLCEDVADLHIDQLGSLECRPVSINEESCFIPLERQNSSLGYLIVLLSEKQAKLLGYVKKASSLLPLAQLGPLGDLLEYLEYLKSVVKLSSWLENIFQNGWQTVAEVFEPRSINLVYRYKNSALASPSSAESQPVIERAKIIDLDAEIPEISVTLIVSIFPEDEEGIVSLRLQLHPLNQTFLPPGFKLIVLEENNNIFLEAEARERDNYIQLQFNGVPNEQFKVQVALNQVSIIESFVI